MLINQRDRKTEKHPSQTELLLNHLIQRGSISNVEAQAIYKMRALPRRIRDLVERGHVINRQWHTDPTGQRYVRYYLA